VFHKEFHAHLNRTPYQQKEAFCMKLGKKRKKLFHPHKTFQRCFQNVGNGMKPTLRASFVCSCLSFLHHDPLGKAPQARHQVQSIATGKAASTAGKAVGPPPHAPFNAGACSAAAKRARALPRHAQLLRGLIATGKAASTAGTSMSASASVATGAAPPRTPSPQAQLLHELLRWAPTRKEGVSSIGREHAGHGCEGMNGGEEKEI